MQCNTCQFGCEHINTRCRETEQRHRIHPPPPPPPPKKKNPTKNKKRQRKKYSVSWAFCIKRPKTVLCMRMPHRFRHSLKDWSNEHVGNMFQFKQKREYLCYILRAWAASLSCLRLYARGENEGAMLHVGCGYSRPICAKLKRVRHYLFSLFYDCSACILICSHTHARTHARTWHTHTKQYVSVCELRTRVRACVSVRACVCAF